MYPKAVTIALFAVSVAVSPAARSQSVFQPPHGKPFGQPWINIVSEGTSTIPFPVIWLSANKLPLRGFPETEILLSPRLLKVISEIALNAPCDAHQVSGMVPGSADIRVKINSKKMAICKLSQKNQCFLLNSIRYILKWYYDENRIEPINNFMRDAYCARFGIP